MAYTPDDEYEEDDYLSEAGQIIQRGERVFVHEWDSGGPGAGAGCTSVYEWRGRFAVSTEEGSLGPYDSLQAALDAGGLEEVTDATVYISPRPTGRRGRRRRRQ
jgi:hypothetical protein